MRSNRLTSGNAIFVIIDLQEKLLPKIFEFERVTANCVLLIKFARAAGIPLLVTTQYERGLGPTVQEIKDTLPEIGSVDKVEFGCFENDRFLEQMRVLGHGRNTVVLCGIESHICLTQTALGALEKGYNVHVASDATSSRTQWNWNIGLDRMGRAGAVISSTEMILYEILKRSDAAAFKAILPYLRNPSP